MISKEIEQLFQQALQCYQNGDQQQAGVLFDHIITTCPNHANAQYLLGKIKSVQHLYVDAILHFNSAVELHPVNYDYRMALAEALLRLGRFEEAAAQMKSVISIKPDSSEAYTLLGDLFRSKGNYDAAERAYKMATSCDEKNVRAFTNLGTILRSRGKFTDALYCYSMALHACPDSAKTLNNRALCLADIGRIKDAEEDYRHALELTSVQADIFSNLLICLCYHHEFEYTTLFEEHKKFGRIHGDAGTKRIRSYTNSNQPERKLRIGYVSSDFRNHSVSYFLEPLLHGHHRELYEPVCYSLVGSEDATTERFRSFSTSWHDCRGLSDEKLAELINLDSIDILIDCNGHTAGNRLKMFGYTPAPVQVTYVGYPNTTGLNTIDYRITDYVADPPGEEQFYTEQLFRLNQCFLCYAPPPDAPDIACKGLPEPSIVLGSFNTLQKLNADVIALWADILQCLPDATLLLKRRGLDDKEARERIVQLFELNGIEEDRLKLINHTASVHDHLNVYNMIDICLDTFPYCGTTTTCEALWMGVPVVTLAGEHHMQRVSASILHSIGLDTLVTTNKTEYRDKVISLAQNASERAILGSTLRDRMASSPICDKEAFVMRFEKALREMWHRWC